MMIVSTTIGQKTEELMPLDQERRDEIKAMVLFELEKMFTGITDKFNSEENHDMMLYLLDVESRVKRALMDVDAKSA